MIVFPSENLDSFDFNTPIAHTQLENHAHGSVLWAIDSGERDAQRDADCSE